jgi:hypothetical protein
MVQPTLSSSPLLNVQVTPRHSIYVDSESIADFIVDAGLSFIHGSPYNTISGGGGNVTADILSFQIETEGKLLASGNVAINTTNTLFQFHLTQLMPRMTAYQISLTGTTKLSQAQYTASAEFYYLPDKTDGSVVKVDYLYGSILYRNNATNGIFQPVLPFGFYADYSGYLNDSYANVEAYVNKGFNAVNPVAAFTDGNMTTTMDYMDELNLLFQYDMRGSYLNLTSVAEQVPLVKDHPSLLMYYTGDEPDGWSYALNSTKLAYDLLASLDKYHPTALVLNCQNYYFQQYASGADIIMEDAYPVGINATYSKWNTTCNTTLGDCGCDDCIGTLLDVPNRIDDLHGYEQWIGSQYARKPVWEVPQAFSGEGYWSRDPTPEETWAMDLLAFNHGAMGRLAWIYPPSDILADAASQLAMVVTKSPVLDFLTGSNPVLIQNGSVGGIDVAYWVLGQEVLIGVVNPVNSSVASVEIQLPSQVAVSTIDAQPWGNISWSLDGSTLIAEGGLAGLSTSYVILK